MWLPSEIYQRADNTSFNAYQKFQQSVPVQYPRFVVTISATHSMENIEDRLAKLGITLPPLPQPMATYVPFTLAGTNQRCYPIHDFLGRFHGVTNALHFRRGFAAPQAR